MVSKSKLLKKVQDASKDTVLIGGMSMMDIYDQVMMDIEPDLLTNVVPYLDSLYKHETPEQTQARSRRYARAFELYESRFSAFMTNMQESVFTLKEEAMEKLVIQERNEREEKIHALEAIFETAS